MSVAGLTFDYHYMIVGSLLTILGFQVLMTGLFAKAYCHGARLYAADRILETLRRHFNLERGLAVGAILFLAGFALDARILVQWLRSGMGAAQRDQARDSGLDPDDHRGADDLFVVLPEHSVAQPPAG